MRTQVHSSGHRKPDFPATNQIIVMEMAYRQQLEETGAFSRRQRSTDTWLPDTRSSGEFQLPGYNGDATKTIVEMAKPRTVHQVRGQEHVDPFVNGAEDSSRILSILLEY